MKKYLTDVFLPTVGRHCDVLIPAGRTIAEVTQLLVEVAVRLTDGSYQYTSETMLLDAETGKPFSPDATVYDSGIRNASRLLLI